MRKLHWAAVWCLCAPAVLAGPAWADNPVVAIRNLTLRVDIHERVATTTMEITYVNYTERPREVTLRWRMAPDVAVHDLAMWVDGMRSPAAILTRVKAQAIYREIVQGKRDPALLEGLGGGLWSLRVFPIPRQGTQKVQVVFSQILQAKDGWVTYQGPAAMPRSTVSEAQDFDFSAAIRCAGGVTDIKAGAHKLGVQRGADGTVTVGFRRETFDVSEPVAFSYRPALGASGPVVAASKTGAPYFAATVPPAKVLAKGKGRPRNVVLVIDTSESMKGTAASVARAGATAIVKHLKPTDRFNIVLAGTDARLWKDKLVAADKNNIAAAIKLIAKPRAQGGTDLAAGLRAAESFNTEPGKPFLLYVFSDGIDMIGAGPQTDIAKPQAKPGRHTGRLEPGPNVQVHWFEIATGEGMSDAIWGDRGFFVYIITGREGLVAGLGESLAIASAHVITDITVTCKDAAGKVMPVAVSQLRADLPITICGPFDKAGPVTVTVSCRLDGKVASASYRIALPEPPKAQGSGPGAATAMSKVWAHLAAEGMFQAMRRGKPAIADLAALIAHSEKHRVLTRTTAFLVLEKDGDYLRRGIARKASFLPAGSTLDGRRTQLAKLGKRNTNPVTVKKIARFRLLASELRRLGHYALAADMLEQIVRLDAAQHAARREAGLLREFVGLQAAIAMEIQDDLFEDYDYRPVLPWYVSLLSLGPEELLPVVGMKKVHIIKHVPTSLLIDWKMQRKLNVRIKEVDFTRTSFKDAIDFLRTSSGIEIFVKWKTLEDEGIDETAEIDSLKLTGVTAQRLLRLILDDVGGVRPLGFYIDEGVVVVSTKTDLAMRTVTRMYDVRDLIPGVVMSRSNRRLYRGKVLGEDSGGGGLFGDDDDDFDFDDDNWPPDLTPLRSVRLSGPTMETLGGTRIYDVRDLNVEIRDFEGPRIDMGRLFTERRLGGDDGRLSDDGHDYPTSRRLAATLTNIIRWTIAPDSWRPDGEIGNLTFFRGLMVVTQNQETHLAIEKLLADLRSKLKGRRDVPADTDDVGAPFPEQMFTENGHITLWVEQLLRAARAGKLSKFSSVRIVKVGWRRFARIGGIWFDVSLTRAAKIHVVRRSTRAAALLLDTIPGLRPCFHLGKSVIVAVDPQTAVALDELGLSKTESADLKKIVKALSKK